MKALLLRALLVSVVLSSVISCTDSGQDQQGIIDSGLVFNDDGTFKIAQFTDLHWRHGAENSTQTAATIQLVLDAEKPDLVILTGDIVTYEPERDGWDDIAALLGKSGIPWTVTLGNHDDERILSRRDVIEILMAKPGFVGDVGADISGSGNFVLKLTDVAGNETKGLIYCFDSQSYTNDHRHGATDWIKFDQIAWYRTVSQYYSDKNGGNPLPALAFFHIPMLEHAAILNREGAQGRSGSAGQPRINSGMFASMVEMNDVMGVFVGHIHSLNQVGIVNTIALGYGQVTGANAVGSMERGGRIIEMYAGEKRFNTWIRTASGTSGHYNFPFGTTFLEDDLDYAPAQQIAAPEPGLRYNYFEGQFKSVLDMKEENLANQGVVSGITLSPATSDDFFGFEYIGYLKVPRTGLYRFYTYSDDGSVLFISGREVVNNDGSRSARRVDGYITLQAGYHDFRLLYFEDYMGEHLEVGIASLNIPEMLLPDSMLFHQ